MALRDPVAVYNAANNFEANLLCNLLNEAGIEAHVTEDVSTVGVWMFGLLPEIHKPQVWTDRADVERAVPLLNEYELRQAEREQAVENQSPASNEPIQATCEECGRTSAFPAEDKGTVQYCPHCSAYMDVGDMNDEDQWWDSPEAKMEQGEEDAS